MHDEIRIAPDRRGEVAVRAAREAGVAEVARVVAGLLERAQDERAERLLPALRARGELGHELAGRGCDLGRLARSHRLRVRAGRRRDLELGEAGEQQLDRLRARVARGRGRAPRRLREASSPATHSFARIISSSTSMCACGSPSRRASATPPRPSNSNTSSSPCTRSAPRAKRRSRRNSRQPLGVCQRLPQLRRHPLAPREDRLDAAVREPLATADDRAVEDGLALRRSLASKGTSTVTQSRSMFGRSEHRSSASSCGSIGATRPGTYVEKARCDAPRSSGEPAGTKWETSAMCTQARSPSPSRLHRDRVVEVLCRLRVDRERELGRAGRRAPPASARGGRTARTRRSAPRSTSRPSSTASIESAGPSTRSRRARPRRRRETTARSPGRTSSSPCRSSDDRPSRARSTARRRRTCLAGRSRRLRASDFEEAADREAGAGGAEQQARRRSRSGHSGRTRAPAPRRRRRCGRGSPAARSPCRAGAGSRRRPSRRGRRADPRA